MSAETPLSHEPARKQVPDAQGRFGIFGRRFVPETLMYALDELDAAYEEARKDPEFHQELDFLLKTYVGRPNPLYFAERLTEHAGGAKIYRSTRAHARTRV